MEGKKILFECLYSYPFNQRYIPIQLCKQHLLLFFMRIFFIAYAVKIHMKKNAAANGLELKERLQGLTATDVTHSRKSKAAIIISHIRPLNFSENPPFQITKHSLLITSRNKTGMSAPSELHSSGASL